jgi:hypothetical protein
MDQIARVRAYPSPKTVVARFGSWNDALSQAGFPRRPRHAEKRTHCMKGHEFTEESTFTYENGKRFCRICRREWERGRRVA